MRTIADFTASRDALARGDAVAAWMALPCDAHSYSDPSGFTVTLWDGSFGGLGIAPTFHEAIACAITSWKLQKAPNAH